MAEEQENSKAVEEELRNALKKVKDEKARADAIIAAIGDGITIQDRDFRIIYQNQIFISMMGNHIGEYCYAAYEGMERTCEGCPVAESFKDGKIHTTVRSVLTDKGMKYFENTSSALRDAEGKIIAGIEVVRDITERKETEEALRESERRYRNLVETAPVVIYHLSAEDGTITSLNQAFERITGWSTEEWIGKPFMPLIHPDDLPRAIETYQAILSGETPPPYELRVLSKSGEYLVGEFTSTPWVEDGKVVGEFGVVSNITERKRVEEKLFETSRTLQSLVEASPIAITTLDPDGIVMMWNPAAEQMFDWSADEVIGRYYTLIPEGKDAEFHVLLQRVLKGESFTGVEVIRRKKDGTLLDVALSTAPFRDFKGDIVGAMGLMTDITERKQTEDELRRSKASLEAAQERAHWGSWELDPATQTGSWSKEMFRLLGRELSQGVPSVPEFMELVHPEDRENIMEAHSRVLRTGEAATIDYRTNPERGPIRAINTSIHAVKNAEGNKVRLTGTALDVTKLKKAEEVLRQVEQQQKAILNNIPDIAWLKDSESRFIIVNEPFGKASGVSPEDLVGKTDLDIWPGDLAERYRADDREVMKTGKRKVVDEPLADKEGKIAWIATIKTPIFNDRGEVIGTTGIARDITERKNIEDLIKASLREKEVLLQEIHHRVKNNLQVISSILNLQSGHVKDDHDRVLFMESRNRIKSMALIHEKLYRSRDLAKINIAEYIRTLAEDLMRSYKITAAGIRLNLDIQDVLLDIDTAVPLGLIVNELLSNSLKYAFPQGREGEIGIALVSDNEGMLTLTVRDNGAGLPEGLDFPQVESLGLQLVKLLTEQISGSVELKRGEGTTFNIVFKALERHSGG